MEIKIISTEIIKPSSPTPAHLRTHKFFLPDNVSFSGYFPVILFYTVQSEDSMKISSYLKNCLSKTLTYYYPLAGKIKDGVSTDCNDHGAIFIETQVVVGEMYKLIQKRDSNMFKQLIPMKAAYFVKSWAEVARGANDIKDAIVDYSYIHPPYDAYASLRSLYEQNHHHYSPTEITGKYFMLDGDKIADLREKIGSEPHLDHPTRFEAITALILSTLIKNADKETHEFTIKQLAAVISINLRNRVNPPLPPQCLGNLVTTTIVKFPIDKEIDCRYLAAEVHKSIRSVIDQYKRNMHVDGLDKGLANSTVINFSDMSRMPFYEADFGWGKPTLLSFIPLSAKIACLMPTNDGVGVEAFITLPKKEMAKFEQDPEFVSYTKPFV
ncbi:Transferase [Melia azedarach]|uniref:Transferase n=1 Tax=Melia azedarach TaxID=155640 RepID=A0ACC1Y7I2_MELAZ|nr:Transferase [Melia azedarach]